VTVPLPLLPVVADGAAVAAVLLPDDELSVVVAVELLELLELADVDVLSAVAEEVGAFPAYEAAAT
jgi:hypothetical protein